MGERHKAVLLQEAIDGLAIVADGIYVDGTFGRGGHSAAIMEKLEKQGRLIAIDKDSDAIAVARQQFLQEPRCQVVQASFAELANVARQHHCLGKVNGILLDLGVSSPQLDEAARGFSFNRDGPLDMRMDRGQRLDAQTWINQASTEDISDVLYRYGEERYSRRIARAIVSERDKQRIETTLQLSEVIKKAHPAWERRIHPATRSFQAIRIFINHELEALEAVLEQALEVLAVGGRLCVISFHSLEDRLVKQFVKQPSAVAEHLPDLPIQAAEQTQRLRRVGKLITASAQELAINPRARSARLRIAEKIK